MRTGCPLASLSTEDKRQHAGHRLTGSKLDLNATVRLGFDANALPENAVRADPSVHQTPIVSELEARTNNRLDEMQVLISAHFA